ncbi:insulinase family protein [Actinoplanes sp. NPDC051470]|uniref:M16 family metallopeptidase n=1 Tax=Actinoplanes sp. NPDC051470 TaxID=3157224 RepID=UPI003419F30D
MRRIEIDGIPAMVGPTTGPMHAGLAFRVGQADETLARRGITHLVEHLALHTFGVADHHYNGTTTPEFTYFHTQGTADEIAAFLAGVCRSLRDLPMHRLDVEKELLRTERNGRQGGLGDSMALWRHGARDYGLTGYPEWGLPAIGPEELRAWVATYFTRGNAALWIAADDVPAGLTLDLPDGPSRPAPRPSSALPRTPAWFPGSSGTVVWDAVVPRQPASGVFTAVLERSLMRSLRQEQGLSYSVNTDYDPRTDGTALITAAADSLPEKRGAVLGGFLDVLAALRFGQVDEKDVATVIGHRVDELSQAEERGGRLPGQALNLVSGRPVEALEQILAEIRAVTPERLTEIAGQAWSTGLLMTPGGRSADWAGLAAAPTGSHAAVQGHAHPSLESKGARLVVGNDGVSIIEDTDVATVRFDQVSAMLAWPDGGRFLIGADGITLRVEPTLYGGSAAAIPHLDARVPAAARVNQPPRSPDNLPRPEPQAQAKARTGRSTGPIIMLAVFIPLMLVSCLLGSVSLITMNDPDPDVRSGSVFLLIFGLALTVGFGFGIVAAIRRLRAARQARRS